MKTIFKLLPIVLFTMIFTSCSSDDDNPLPVNEEEVITTLTVTFTPQGTGSPVTLKTQDLDGDGPNDPVVTIVGTFAANTTYNGTIEFLNELENPAEDITEEVEEEGLEHQIFYSTTNNLGTFTYTDTDTAGNPIGITFTFESGVAATGNMTFTLRHEPAKDATGVSNGDITNAGGETDIEATFNNVTIQ